MKNEFLNAVKERRTYYAIGKDVTVSDDTIKEIINDSVKFSPTSFNSQSGRIVLLLNEEHDKLWEITKEALRKIVPEDKFSDTENKINSFKSGYGTVLFFEDNVVIEKLQEQFALYKDNFPIWSQQSSGMLQLIVWTALESEGLGASLQHYNELIEEDIKREWNIEGSWKLIGQMPFGSIKAAPDEKEFLPLEARIKVFNK